MESKERISWIAIPIVVLIGLGLAWAGSQSGLHVGNLPIFALAIALAFGIQWIAFIPAFLRQSESFFDLTGSLTFITVMASALALSGKQDARSIILALLIIVWAIRLGTFLASRIHKAGEDKRFKEIKKSFPRFLMTWTLQGLWVSFSIAAALAAITAERTVEIGIVAMAGIIIWLVGFAFEAIADRQKKNFRAKPSNRGKFIQSGLWAWSRHPNYFGEILLWLGIALIALPVLQGWQFLTLISPLFIYLLLTRISGIPMLEKSADQRWGGQKDYEAYKKQTPVLVPRPPKDQ